MAVIFLTIRCAVPTPILEEARRQAAATEKPLQLDESVHTSDPAEFGWKGRLIRVGQTLASGKQYDGFANLCRRAQVYQPQYSEGGTCIDDGRRCPDPKIYFHVVTRVRVVSLLRKVLYAYDADDPMEHLIQQARLNLQRLAEAGQANSAASAEHRRELRELLRCLIDQRYQLAQAGTQAVLGGFLDESRAQRRLLADSSRAATEELES